MISIFCRLRAANSARLFATLGIIIKEGEESIC